MRKEKITGATWSDKSDSYATLKGAAENRNEWRYSGMTPEKTKEDKLLKNQNSTVFSSFLICILRLKIWVKEVGKCSFAFEKFVVRADLRNSAVDHHDDLIQLRQEADTMCH